MSLHSKPAGLPCPPVSPIGSGCFGLWQHPRYMAAKKNTPVHFICYTRQPHAMQWYKAPADGEEFQALDQSSDRFSIKSTNDYINFTIFRISYEDNGIYVCDSKNLTEEKRQPYLCGTELRVMSEWQSHRFHHFPCFSIFFHLFPNSVNLTSRSCAPSSPCAGYMKCAILSGMAIMGLPTWASDQQWVLHHAAGGSLYAVCPSHRCIPDISSHKPHSPCSWSCSGRPIVELAPDASPCRLQCSGPSQGTSSHSPPLCVPSHWERGTERGPGVFPVLLLPGRSNIQQIQNRNTLKDTIIIIQTILLVIFISVPMLLFLEKVSDSIPSSGAVPGFGTAILPVVPHVLGKAASARLCLWPLNGSISWGVGLPVGAVGPGFGAGDGGPHRMLCWWHSACDFLLHRVTERKDPRKTTPMR